MCGGVSIGGPDTLVSPIREDSLPRPAAADADTVESADEFRGGESVNEFHIRDGDSVISDDWVDPDTVKEMYWDRIE